MMEELSFYLCCDAFYHLLKIKVENPKSLDKLARNANGAPYFTDSANVHRSTL